MNFLPSTLTRPLCILLACFALWSCGSNITDPPAPLPNADIFARYVRFEPISSISGDGLVAVAELNVLDGNNTPLPRTNWKISASSTDGTSADVSLSMDGDPSTSWKPSHPVSADKPAFITVDLGSKIAVAGFQYRSRKGVNLAQAVKGWRVYTSDNGTDWTLRLENNFAANDLEKTVLFAGNAYQFLTLAPVRPLNHVVGQNVSFALNAVQPLNEKITYSAASLPPGVTLNPSTGNIVGTPSAAGQYSVQVSVTDNRGDTTQRSFSWDIKASSVSARYVRLEAGSEVNTDPEETSTSFFVSMAEFDLLNGSGVSLPRTGWVATADSEDTKATQGPAQLVLDGDLNTLWHTKTAEPHLPFPHTLTVDLGSSQTFAGFRYTPRQDGEMSGTIKDWRFYVSDDGVNWTLVGQGVFASDTTVKDIRSLGASTYKNPTEAENAKTASEGVSSAWEIARDSVANNHEIEGYASATSINRGESINLFVNVTNPLQDPTYTMDIYRIGWYGGAGGRRIFGPITLNSVQQPACSKGTTPPRLVECDWQSPYVLRIPTSTDATVAPSGVYLAKLTTSQTKKSSYIIFVVRDDSRKADFLFQSSVTTYAAYNTWGGRGMYDEREKVYASSFNRPYNNYSWSSAYDSRYLQGAGDFIEWELHTVRFLERQAYDVVYSTNIDTHVNPERLKQFRAFLSVGHDEYWTRGIYDAVESARNAGVNLAFLGANSAFWGVRLEASNGVPNRRIVGYRYDAELRDPKGASKDSTVQWRATPLNRPEAALLGIQYQFNTVNEDFVINDCSSWICDGTGLKAGDILPGLLGYEVDGIDPIYSPKNITVIGRSPYPANGQTRYSNMSFYTHPSGANVFATGTNQWAWGFDRYLPLKDLYDPRVERMTKNVFDRFLVLPERNP